MDLIRDLYRHMEWADAAVWAAVLESEPACADELTRERLHHVHLVQRAFLCIWRGEPIDPHAGEGLDPPALARWAREYYPQAQAYLAAVSEEMLAAVLAVPWTREVADRLGFEPASTTLSDTLAQVYAHTAHHRGQLATRLRELGASPPLIDFIAWVWQGRPPARWPPAAATTATAPSGAQSIDASP